MKKWFVIVSVLALLVAHQDYWQWDRADLVYGFMPYTMAYNIGISLATALLWILVCTFCWPTELDDLEELKQPAAKDGVKATGSQS